MARRGRRSNKDSQPTPSSTKIVLNPKQITKASKKHLGRRKKLEEEDSLEISEPEDLNEVLEENSEEDPESENSDVSEEQDDLEASDDDIGNKQLTERQKYTMRKKLDQNFQDELNIPSLDQFRKAS